MRIPLIAGNWKMNNGVKEAQELASALSSMVGARPEIGQRVEVLLCPPFTSISAVATALGDSSIKLGAQNVHWEESGAFTGEISPAMLRELGCEYAIVGHSERRQYFEESDATINRRLRGAIKGGLKPIICVGETKEQRDQGRTEEILREQVSDGLVGLTEMDALKVTVAYEPLWAIGTGQAATPADANTAAAFIRHLLVETFSEDTAEQIRVQYGGSVKPGNIAAFMEQPDIDGALVGGASLQADSFYRIAEGAVGGQ